MPTNVLIENVVTGSTKTVMGNLLEANKFFALPPQYYSNTTLNEALNINKDILPNTTEQSKALYYCIGNKGHDVIKGTDGIPINVNLDHDPRHANLYGMLPFVLREIGNDISVSMRSKFALRKIVQVNGVSYIAYHLRRIPKVTDLPKIYYITVVDGVESDPVPYIAKEEFMTPKPPTITNGGVNATTGNFLRVMATIKLELDAEERAEVLNAAKIIYGHENRAIVSEVGLVSAVDRALDSPTGSGGTIRVEETVGSVITNFLYTYTDLTKQTLGLEVKIGAVEPMFERL